MAVEVWSYRLVSRGKPVGSQVVKTWQRGAIVALESKLVMHVGAGQQTVIQKSQAHRDSGRSVSFQEEAVGPSERRQFRLDFDEASGLVRASRGTGDVADAPYTRPYQDPLGLLYQLRGLHDERTVRVPMLGKDVLIENLGTTQLDTVFGERQARVLALYPGCSFVYVDTSPPNALLKLTQRLDGSVIEATLIKVDEEAAAPPEAPPPVKRKRRKRRRKGRRSKG